MAEKKSFADRSILKPLPARCCGRCAHGREVKDAARLTTMVECRASPPVVLLLGTPQGVLQRSVWPVLAPEEVGCDQFKLAQNPKSAQDSN
jgi:hypothetical protein